MGNTVLHLNSLIFKFACFIHALCFFSKKKNTKEIYPSCVCDRKILKNTIYMVYIMVY